MEVVATGVLAGSNIPVVVKNNSEETVFDVLVKVEARDAAGSLIGVGESLSNHALKPSILNPGEIALGFVYIEGEFPTDTTFEFTANSSTEPPAFGAYDMNVEFGEVTWLWDRIVGEMINPSGEEVTAVYLMVTCIGGDGMPLHSDVASIEESIGARESTSFQLSGVFGDLSLCENFLIAGSGR